MVELTKTFFDTFGIEPREKVNQTFNGAEFKIETIKDYPQITDRILLELICIKNKELISIVQIKGNNLEELKSYILQTCIKGYTKYSNSSLSEYRELADNLKHQVRTLFEEG